EWPVQLPPHGVEEICRGSDIGDRQIVFGTHHKKSFQTGTGMFRALSFITVGQQHHQSAHITPFALTCGYKLINDSLCSIVKVPKLSFPYDQGFRCSQRISVLKSEYRKFRKQGIVYHKLALLFRQSIEPVQWFKCFGIIYDSMSMGKRTSFDILPAHSHVAVIQQYGTIRGHFS